MADRRAEYKEGGATTAAASTDRRRYQVSVVAKERRDALLRNKRLRREPLAANGSANIAELSEAPSEAAVQQVVEQLQQERSIGSVTHLQTLQQLRQVLSTGDEEACRIAVAAGAVPLLVKALQPASVANDRKAAAVSALEGAWTLTNLAAADHEVASAVLPAAPALMLHLPGGSGISVAQQAAWALGNLAGDSADFRARLVANGVLAPLAKLATAPVAPGAVPGGPDLAAAGTAAWALSNVVKGAGAEVGQLLAIPSAALGLVRLLEVEAHGDSSLAAEGAWVATYLTAASQGHLTRLVEAGLVPLLLDRLIGAAPLSPAAEAVDRALLVPVLRTAGNVAAGGGGAALTQLLQHASGAAIPALLRCMQSSHRGIAKEAAWAVSNVAGAPGRAGVDALVAAGGAPIVVATLKQSVFDIRKEAAFAVANICAGGGGGHGDPAALTALVGRDRAALEAMLDLIRCAPPVTVSCLSGPPAPVEAPPVGESAKDSASPYPASSTRQAPPSHLSSTDRSPDADAAAMGVQFTEMVLRVMPEGPAAVEAADGIDALESLHFRGPDSDMQRLSSQLVDHYFGEEYG